MARNLTDCYDGFLKDMRYVIIDRDPLYTPCFRKMLRDTGTKPLRLPRRSPDLNSFAERFVLTVKGERLDKIIPLGKGHLRSAIKEFMAHYHAERNHQGTVPALPFGSIGKSDRFHDVSCQFRAENSISLPCPECLWKQSHSLFGTG